MADTKYNGWTNYETWLVNLWMDNEKGAQEYWRERAEECVAHTDDRHGAVAAFSNELEYLIEDQVSEKKLDGLLGDLMNAAVSAVNWDEIARHYIDAVLEEAT